jgi:hypothetical protein
MGVLDSLNDLQPKSIIRAIVVITATLCPGVFAIYLFKYDLFIKLDSFKLILLALSFTIPFLCVNINVDGIERNRVDKIVDFDTIIFSGGVRTIVKIPICIAISYYLKWHLLGFVVIAVGLHLLSYVILFIKLLLGDTSTTKMG